MTSVFQISRLFVFLHSPFTTLAVNGPVTVMRWISLLFHYAWSAGGHRPLIQSYLSALTHLMNMGVTHPVQEIRSFAVDAACQIATWTAKNQLPEARSAASLLEAVYRATPAGVKFRRSIGITLAGQPGELTHIPPSEWARCTLDEFGDQVSDHERIQLLIASCATTEAVDKTFPEVLPAVRQYAHRVASERAGDRALAVYDQIRLFGILAPALVSLMQRGRCREALELMAAWFAVNPERQRTSPVCLFAVTREGALYSFENAPLLIPGESSHAHRSLIELTNRLLETSIVVTDDPTFPVHAIRDYRDDDKGLSQSFERVLAQDYYRLSDLQAYHDRCRPPASGLVLLRFVHEPLQAVMLKRAGFTWPLVTSYEEPLPDRPLRKVLLLTEGTHHGEAEVESIAACLRSHGVEVETHVNEGMSPDVFKVCYSAPGNDVVWVAAPGEFDPDSPHDAYISLSWDGETRITLDELVELPVPHQQGRRLLVLNVCYGATTLTTDAPPRLGMGAMLTCAQQAVVSHLWPAHGLASAAFGVLLAVALYERGRFFSGFCDAVTRLRLPPEQIRDYLQEHVTQARQVTDRLSATPHHLLGGGIKTWGSPAFYE